MMNSKLVTDTLKTTVSLLLMGGIWLLPLPLVIDTVPTPRGTAQSSSFFEDEGRSDGEIFQRSEQEPREPVSLEISDSVYEITITNNSSLDWEIQTRSQDWLNLNRGDGSKDIVQVVIFRF